MSPAMTNPASRRHDEQVAGPPPASYTAAMGGDRSGPRGAWWREGLRSWIPMLAIGVTLLISIQSQMLGMQRQIGGLQGQIGGLRAEFRDVIREEMSSLRDDLEGQIEALRREVEDLGNRMTRIETLLETHLREHASSASSGDQTVRQDPEANTG